MASPLMKRGRRVSNLFLQGCRQGADPCSSHTHHRGAIESWLITVSSNSQQGSFRATNDKGGEYLAHSEQCIMGREYLATEEATGTVDMLCFSIHAHAAHTRTRRFVVISGEVEVSNGFMSRVTLGGGARGAGPIVLLL